MQYSNKNNRSSYSIQNQKKLLIKPGHRPGESAPPGPLPPGPRVRGTARAGLAVLSCTHPSRTGKY